MKYFTYSFLLFLFMQFSGSPVFSQPEVTPALEEKISSKNTDELIPLNIRLSSQYNSETLERESMRIPAGESRRQFVIDKLKAFSASQQASLISWLEEMEKQGKVTDITPLWIANIVHCKASPDVIAELMYRKDLARLDYDQQRYALMESTGGDNGQKSGNEAWNVTKVKAQMAWSQGFTGQDIIVGVMDTGVNYNHADLQGNMWTHPDYPNHGYNFVNNNHTTMDNQGHGTHVAGTVAGHGASGTTTGIAPDAIIMSLKVLGDNGSGTEAGVWAGIQFGVENGAHILSLSLGWKHAWNPDRASWRTAFDNAKAAGVISAVAAGNEGNSFGDMPPSEVRTPGDVPAPWLHPDQTLSGGTSGVVAVGSTTSTDNLSGFSSKGPVTWQNVSPFNDYAYNPGIGLIRPDIVAPGSDILSLTHNNNSGYTSKSGTSMATPAVAGVMALILSKNPNISPAELAQILEETAHSLSATKSNTFGSGLVDVAEAIAQTPFVGINYQAHTFDDSQGNNDGMINPGELIKINLTLQNPTDETIQSATARVTVVSDYITLIEDEVSLGNFPAESIIEFEEAFTFQVSDTIPGNHLIGFSLEIFSDNEPEDQWRSHFTGTAFAPDLSIQEMVIDDSQGNNDGVLDPGETALVRIRIENTGQLSSQPLELTLSGYRPYIFVEQPQLTVSAIGSESHQWAEFLVTVHEVINPGSTSDFNLSLTSGAYHKEKEYTQKIGQIIETWSSEDFDSFDWNHEGSANWYLVSNESHSGTYSARSGAISHSQQTGLVLEYDVLANDSIAFFRKVSSENNYDWLEFYIDDERVGRWSGNRDWERVVFPVEPGQRTFRWLYKKDASVSEGTDCAWIDNIELPARASTTAFAGFDQQFCIGSPIQLRGFAMHYDQLQWITSGDGTFSSPNNMNTLYIPGQQDLQNGQAVLSMEVQYQDQQPVTHNMNLSLLPAPVVNLGGDQLLCTDKILELNASQGEGNFTYLWQDGSTAPTFTVIPADYQEQQATFWVEITNQEGCQANDTILITFDECLNVVDLSVENSLSLFPNPTRENINVSFFNPEYQNATITISNINGQTVKSLNNNYDQGQVNISLNLTGLDQGVYFLTITGKQFSSTRKLILN